MQTTVLIQIFYVKDIGWVAVINGGQLGDSVLWYQTETESNQPDFVEH